LWPMVVIWCHKNEKAFTPRTFKIPPPTPGCAPGNKLCLNGRTEPFFKN
jgi:hypothetical protein